METLIVCEDREFKQRAVNFMNNIAFNAEKTAVASLREASDKLRDNPKLLNMIIDGQMFGDKINETFPQMTALCDKRELQALLYLSEEQAKTFAHREHGLTNLAVQTLPFEKALFNDTFHRRGIRPGAPQAQAAGADAAKNKATTAHEATEHVRETIAMINVLGNNRAALDQLATIGQRFNGIMGTFSYFASKNGYKELRDLARIIDILAKHYHRPEAAKAISDSHFHLLLGSAKCSFRLLQVLRGSQEVPPELRKEASDLSATFAKASDIAQTSPHSQDEVDALLVTAGKAES